MLAKLRLHRWGTGAKRGGHTQLKLRLSAGCGINNGYWAKARLQVHITKHRIAGEVRSRMTHVLLPSRR